jgi:Mg2+ and Co2+ transporter CorA
MASARTTYQGGLVADGAAPPGHPFVWVSLRDPSPEELAAVQREFGLPGPLVDRLGTTAKRSALEVVDELLLVVVKTATWVAPAQAIRLVEVQLVLADGFVITVDGDAALLERVRKDLQTDPELAGAGPAALLPCVVDHAVEGYGPVLAALNDAVEEVAEDVFSPTGTRQTKRSTSSRARCWSSGGPRPHSARCWTVWPASRQRLSATSSGGPSASSAPTCCT